MNNRILSCLIALLPLIVTTGACADECDDPKSSEQVAQCLGAELRNSDAKINSSYQELMGKLNESDRASLRQAQRNWIRERDSGCQVDTKETNREKWYQALLKDYVKTVCVTGYTRRRTAQLDAMLGKSAVASAPPAAPPAPARPEIAYDKKLATTHANGKWYFELAINYGEAVKIEPCVVAAGISDKQFLQGILDNIRPRDANKDVMRYGFAVDLDNGKLYISKNGAWINGEPGSNLGRDVKLGRNYHAAFATSADSVDPYLEHKAIVPSFGDGPMTYALPAGYSPWRNKKVE